MSKRKEPSGPLQVVNQMNDLIKDPKNNEKTKIDDEDQPQAKLEDIIAEIENMVDEPVSKKRPVLSRLENDVVLTTDNMSEGASILIPANRIKPLKENWDRVQELIAVKLKLQMRFNTKNKHFEMRRCPETRDEIAIQRAADFIKAFVLGFELKDAEALIRMDELFVETFNVVDIKQTLKGDHLARAIGRIAGTGGRNKHTIENSTKTRIVLAGQRVSILGSFQNCRTARRTICAVVMGTPNNKIHGTLRQIAERLGDRY